VALATAAALAGACRGRALSEQDCLRLAGRIEQAWGHDAQEAARIAGAEGVREYVRDEQRRLGGQWLARCRAGVGGPVDERELACLEGVQTIDDVYECARAVR
jgi:hypothetical protein